jgi:CheY-like chemotaxis protein
MPRKRILIVDDDANLLEVLQLRFAKTNFDVTVASDGRTALDILRESEPLDLVLTDFMMPELNGIELTRAIKGNSKLFDTPVVVMSNNADPEFRKRAIELGARAYFLKTEGARTIVERTIRMIADREPEIPKGPTLPGGAAQVQAMRQSLVALLRLTAHTEGLPVEARNAMISAEKLVESLFAAVVETET